MALVSDATLTFLRYILEDGGIRCWFVCLLPGAGEPTDYDILLTDAELATVITGQDLKTLVETKLKRKLRAAGMASKLDGFIGRSVVI